MTEPIHKTVTVPLRPSEAFELFTDRLADWWPIASHSVSAARGALPKSVKMDKREGGHVVETTDEGEQARWATVTTWQPGQALALSWYVGRSSDEATDILVVFTPTDTGTRVELTHDGFDRLGETASLTQDNYKTGWDLVLGQCFAQFCARFVTA